MFSKRGCVPDNPEWVKKYSPLGNISQYTPKGARTVLDNMISEDHAIQYHHSSLLPVNIKKYIPTVW